MEWWIKVVLGRWYPNEETDAWMDQAAGNRTTVTSCVDGKKNWLSHKEKVRAGKDMILRTGSRECKNLKG